MLQKRGNGIIFLPFPHIFLSFFEFFSGFSNFFIPTRKFFHFSAPEPPSHSKMRKSAFFRRSGCFRHRFCAVFRCSDIGFASPFGRLGFRFSTHVRHTGSQFSYARPAHPTVVFRYPIGGLPITSPCTFCRHATAHQRSRLSVSQQALPSTSAGSFHPSHSAE